MMADWQTIEHRKAFALLDKTISAFAQLDCDRDIYEKLQTIQFNDRVGRAMDRMKKKLPLQLDAEHT